jgi:hypothetical protein
MPDAGAVEELLEGLPPCEQLAGARVRLAAAAAFSVRGRLVRGPRRGGQWQDLPTHFCVNFLISRKD